MSKSAVKQVEAEALRRNEAKWSKPLMAAGWNAIPSIIIEKQHADNLPCPSVETIAKAVGVKPRTVQKRVAALQAAGLLTRTERRKTRFGSDTNLYSFEGLIKAALPYAQEKIAKRKKREQEEKDRIARKKPKLAVVQAGQ